MFALISTSRYTYILTCSTRLFVSFSLSSSLPLRLLLTRSSARSFSLSLADGRTPLPEFRYSTKPSGERAHGKLGRYVCIWLARVKGGKWKKEINFPGLTSSNWLVPGEIGCRGSSVFSLAHWSRQHADAESMTCEIRPPWPMDNTQRNKLRGKNLRVPRNLSVSL